MTGSSRAGGGLDRYFFDLFRALPGAGVDPVGLVTGDQAEIDAFDGDLRRFAADDDSTLVRARRLRAVAQPIVADSDVVASHFAAYALPILDQLAKRPLAMHFHGPWALESAVERANPLVVRVRSLAERIVYARADVFIVLSRDVRATLHREYGVPLEKIRVVKPGVDLQRFHDVGTRADARERLGWPRDRPTVVTVRRLVSSKGLENLVKATALVAHDVPDVLVKVVGTGPLAEALAAAIAERGLSDHVDLVGHVGDTERLSSIYGAADVSIVPSTVNEGFGLIVFESLACGTPPLVTPIGGLPETVEDLDSTLILASPEPADLARGITRALLEPASLPTKSRCLEFVGQFTWRSAAARIAEVYREIA